MKQSHLLFAVLSLSGALFVAGCGSSDIGKAPSEAGEQAIKEQSEEAKKSVSGIKELTVRGGKLEGADSQGRPLWRLEAREIKTGGASLAESGMPERATLLDAKASLFRSGKIESSFTAKQMTLFQTPKGVRIAMTGGVTARSASLATGGKGAVDIQSARADVDVTKRIVAAAGGVTVKHKNMTLKSQQLRSQTELAKLEMNGKVEAQAPNARVTAERASFNWKNDQLTAQNVTATRQGTTLSGRLLAANTEASRGTIHGNVTAKGPQGNAKADNVEFDWGRDRILINMATLTNSDGQLSARQIRTDSKLRVAQASGVTATSDGAKLTATSATGFNGLTRLTGTNATLTRGDLVVTAGSVQAANWSKAGGTITATGGVTAKNSGGTVRAQRATVNGENSVEAAGGVIVRTGDIVANADKATWLGGASGTITAVGRVEIRGRGAVIRAQSGQSDTGFQNATLRGDVRANLPDGSLITAPSVQKQGEKIFASNANATLRSKEAGALSLRAAKVEANFDGSRASASGGVTLRSASGTTVTAPRAIYDQKAKTVIAMGGVVLTDKARGLVQRGDTLRADLTLKQFTIDNVRGQAKGNLFEGKNLFN